MEIAGGEVMSSGSASDLSLTYRNQNFMDPVSHVDRSADTGHHTGRAEYAGSREVDEKQVRSLEEWSYGTGTGTEYAGFSKVDEKQFGRQYCVNVDGDCSVENLSRSSVNVVAERTHVTQKLEGALVVVVVVVVVVLLLLLL
ncbi:hypothetical protein ElyMa_003256600 [Elysia marginata]|uniref:Uncharacterized protein n=1 Tax=Elysia marginata TaxID=1093978 RepID=A0AAV4J9K1_9GAST|nr:hypothetical protein ElyMa_003256600 [Elysia marginata]